MAIRTLRPRNIKPGMLMRVGVTPTSSDMLEVMDVEIGRGKVTGKRVYRVTVRMPACYPPFTGKPEVVLVWPDERREVKSSSRTADVSA